MGLAMADLVPVAYCLVGIGVVISRSILLFNALKWLVLAGGDRHPSAVHQRPISGNFALGRSSDGGNFGGVRAAASGFAQRVNHKTYRWTIARQANFGSASIRFQRHGS